MRIIGSFAFAAFVGGASAMISVKESATVSRVLRQREPPQLQQAREEWRPKKPPAKRVVAPSNPDRGYIFSHERFDETDLPVTAYGYPYVPRPPEDIAAEEHARALKQLAQEWKGMKGMKEDTSLMEAVADKEARLQAQIKDAERAQEERKAKAKALRAEVKAKAMKDHLRDLLQVPLDGPVEWAREETPESAQKPWPPEEDEEPAVQAPETPAAEHAEVRAADNGLSDLRAWTESAGPQRVRNQKNSLSVAESRPAVQGKAQMEEAEAEMQAQNPFYLRKCREIFDGLDVDGNEAIEEEEIFAFFDAAWHAYDPRELMPKFFAEADRDHDGQVSTAEWYTFAKTPRTSPSRAERWDPLQHLKRGVSSTRRFDKESNVDQLEGYYQKIATRLFHVMDANRNDVASKAEMQAFIDRKYPTKDPVQFSEIFLAEADTNGDSNVTMSEFQNFAAESRKMGTNSQEKWNPLLRVIRTVRPDPALATRYSQ